METLSWEQLAKYLSKGAPALLNMGGKKGVQIGFEPARGRIFLRAPLEKGVTVPASPYAELTLEANRVGAASVMEVSSTSSSLYPEFHRLAGLFAEELERRGQTAIGAFLAVAERWRGLTAMRQLLSPEEQLGLFGELAVLQALVKKYGPDAVSSWTARMGDLPERHDFRLRDMDLEVKSTRAASRHHVIHGLRQLEPSRGHALFLVSLKFEAAGMNGGTSLVDRVQNVREKLRTKPQALKDFEARLEAARYRDADAVYYQERLIAADTPMLIPVDGNCPRIVPSAIVKTLGPELVSRIDNSMTYRINVEGLGTRLAGAGGAGTLGSILIE